MAFHKKDCSYLQAAVCEYQNAEQTQEIRLTDDMPDIGRIVGSWGQFIMRGKEWRSDSVIMTGGLMVWILYAPEDGSRMRSLDTWIPFQMKWDLPEGTPEGKLLLQGIPRYVDARIVSPRKAMVRCGAGASVQAYVTQSKEICSLDEAGENVELLHSRYPVCLPKEAGEKSFEMEETLSADANVSRILYCRLCPEIIDKKILSGKMAFRGNANLHVLYEDGAGELRSQDFALPFSQFTELNGSFSSEAHVEILPSVTSLETECMEDGSIQLKCGITAQYSANDIVNLDVIEDAYSPGRQLTIEREQLMLPAVLESRQDVIHSTQTLQAQGMEIVDISFLPDYPKQFREGDNIAVEVPGSIQLIYRDTNGILQSANCRWEGKLDLPTDKAVSLFMRQAGCPISSVQFGEEEISLQTEFPIRITAVGGSGVPMVTALELGEEQEPDVQRPSLILRRADGCTLWELAKLCGSTVDSIKRANGLQEEPLPRQMLLIPVR